MISGAKFDPSVPNFAKGDPGRTVVDGDARHWHPSWEGAVNLKQREGHVMAGVTQVTR